MGPHDMDLLPDPTLLSLPPFDAPTAEARKVWHQPRRQDILHTRYRGRIVHSIGVRFYWSEFVYFWDGK